MKTIVLILFVLLCINTSGQIKGINFNESVPFYTISTLTNDGTLIKVNNGGYELLYGFNIEGIKSSFEKINQILLKNNLLFDAPSTQYDTLPLCVSGYNNYEAIYHYLKYESVEFYNIGKHWEFEGWDIFWIVKKDVVVIALMNFL